MAIQTLKRWGNSLAVRIPANVANEVAFSEGQDVDEVCRSYPGHSIELIRLDAQPIQPGR
jgi:hypothetical protein